MKKKKQRTNGTNRKPNSNILKWSTTISTMKFSAIKSKVCPWAQNPRFNYMVSTRNVHKIWRDRLNINGSKKIYHANTNHKKPRVATLISDKIDPIQRILPLGKEGDYIKRKRSIHQKDILIINMYTTNSRAPKDRR